MTLPPTATIATPRKPLPVSRQRHKLTETWKYAELRRVVASNCETGSRQAIATDATCRSGCTHYRHNSDTWQFTSGFHISSETCQFSVTPELNGGGGTVRGCSAWKYYEFLPVASLSQTGSRPTRATNARCRQGYVSPIAITATCRKALPVYTHLMKLACRQLALRPTSRQR